MNQIKSNKFIGIKSNDRSVTIYNTVHITYVHVEQIPVIYYKYT